MPVPIPQSVRRALGEEAVVDFMPWMERWLSESIKEKAVPRDEYREVLSRLDGLEKDVSLIKEELAGFRVELGQIRSESREDRGLMRAEFKDGQAQLRAEFKEGQAQMRAEFKEGQAQMRAELGELRRDMHERFDQMHHQMIGQTRWFIGALTVLVTVVSALLAVSQFTP